MINYSKAFDFTNLLQWTFSNADTTGTTFARPEYRGVCILEASDIFPYMAMRSRECYKGVFPELSPLLYTSEKS